MDEIRTLPDDAQRSTYVSIAILAMGGLLIGGLVIFNALVDRKQIFSEDAESVLRILPGSPWTWALVILISSAAMMLSVFRGMNRTAAVTLAFNGFWCVLVGIGLLATVFNYETDYSGIYPALYLVVAMFHLKNAVLAWRGRHVRFVRLGRDLFGRSDSTEP